MHSAPHKSDGYVRADLAIDFDNFVQLKLATEEKKKKRPVGPRHRHKCKQRFTTGAGGQRAKRDREVPSGMYSPAYDTDAKAPYRRLKNDDAASMGSPFK